MTLAIEGGDTWGWRNLIARAETELGETPDQVFENARAWAGLMKHPLDENGTYAAYLDSLKKRQSPVVGSHVRRYLASQFELKTVERIEAPPAPPAAAPPPLRRHRDRGTGCVRSTGALAGR